MPNPEQPHVRSRLQESALAGRSAGDGALPEIRASALQRVPRLVATWIVRSGQRRALRELAQEGRLLSDVGLTREQALREAAKPFWRR